MTNQNKQEFVFLDHETTSGKIYKFIYLAQSNNYLNSYKVSIGFLTVSLSV